MPRSTFLTATSIPANPTGDYPQHYCDWFFPHETIRREALRAEHALRYMENIVEYPWKAVNFRTWIRDFYFPAIHAHHDVEEDIIGPHYRALLEKEGENTIILQVWGSKEHDHKGLLDLMDKVQRQAEALCNEAQGLTGVNTSQHKIEAVMAQLQALRSVFAAFKTYMFTHLEEEEQVWPGIFQRFGKAEVKKAVAKIIKQDMSKAGPEGLAAKSFAGAFLDNAGSSKSFPPSKRPAEVPGALKLDPWCSEAVIDRFLSEVPWIPRKLIFPGFHKRYVLHWKVMIDTVCSDKDVLRLRSDGSLPVKASGCFCISA
ncbi:hypothetical protein GUITHDRAFT_144360 [Guillardia theta CCMP2712]|uniref:Hemerythrin-like domain-containing protein n=1 Tax=Guillardia theta (strain CCMP2712) TaxID=905079 RepID=L1IPM9_GUITC|nr:hypothetical protein GUITHDRAFT_144360 [Guillardia theta CCMP2712]EKX38246.1 hypothetical protein GUITHDRAFT_144360 [Guillardia theta CCMP2712]|eukprot:XP_005825226.1 hypothetical protein GUITHDRAFT_144360 [Guillardia theta CCMP2712]